MIHVANYAIVLSASRQQILAKDMQRVAITFQNQEAAANIYRRFSGDGTPRSYLLFVPGAIQVMDLWTPTDEIWAYTDTPGAIFTIEVVTDDTRPAI